MNEARNRNLAKEEGSFEQRGDADEATGQTRREKGVTGFHKNCPMHLGFRS